MQRSFTLAPACHMPHGTCAERAMLGAHVNELDTLCHLMMGSPTSPSGPEADLVENPSNFLSLLHQRMTQQKQQQQQQGRHGQQQLLLSTQRKRHASSHVKQKATGEQQLQLLSPSTAQATQSNDAPACSAPLPTNEAFIHQTSQQGHVVEGAGTGCRVMDHLVTAETQRMQTRQLKRLHHANSSSPAAKSCGLQQQRGKRRQSVLHGGASGGNVPQPASPVLSVDSPHPAVANTSVKGKALSKAEPSTASQHCVNLLLSPSGEPTARRNSYSTKRRRLSGQLTVLSEQLKQSVDSTDVVHEPHAHDTCIDDGIGNICDDTMLIMTPTARHLTTSQSMPASTPPSAIALSAGGALSPPFMSLLPEPATPASSAMLLPPPQPPQPPPPPGAAGSAHISSPSTLPLSGLAATPASSGGSLSSRAEVTTVKKTRRKVIKTKDGDDAVMVTATTKHTRAKVTTVSSMLGWQEGQGSVCPDCI